MSKLLKEEYFPKRKKTPEDMILQLIEDMDFDTLIIWANILEVEVNYPPVDDMWPEWDNELRVEVVEALIDAISSKT